MSEESRRPIKARSLSVMQKSAAALARTNITPNQISVFSVFVSFLLPAGLIAFGPGWAGCLMAVLGIQLRLLCNLLDGMVAVEGGKRSPLGDIFNEYPDRLSDTVILVGFSCAAPASIALPLALTAALLALLTAYTRVLGASLGTRHYFSGPMAKQHRMAFLTLILLAIPMAGVHGPRIVEGTLALIALGSGLTCIRRLRAISIEIRARR